jgi:hypothetical protein
MKTGTKGVIDHLTGKHQLSQKGYITPPKHTISRAHWQASQRRAVDPKVSITSRASS